MGVFADPLMGPHRPHTLTHSDTILYLNAELMKEKRGASAQMQLHVE